MYKLFVDVHLPVLSVIEGQITKDNQSHGICIFSGFYEQGQA